jgi:hypothetical protein
MAGLTVTFNRTAVTQPNLSILTWSGDNIQVNLLIPNVNLTSNSKIGITATTRQAELKSIAIIRNEEIPFC